MAEAQSESLIKPEGALCGIAGLMYFRPSEKAKAVLNDWHQTCVEAGSNNQPAWNKVFNLNRRNSMDYHVMTKDRYPHGYLLEQRGFFANDQQVCSLPTNHSYHCRLLSTGAFLQFLSLLMMPSLTMPGASTAALMNLCSLTIGLLLCWHPLLACIMHAYG